MKPVLMFDIDGTVMGAENLILDTTVEAIQQARKNGAYALINTGRSKAALPQKVIDIGFDGMICGCGSYVEWQGEMIQNHLISDQILEEAKEVFAHPTVFASYEGVYHVYYQRGEDETIFQTILNNWQKDQALSKAISIEEGMENVNKLTVYFQDPAYIRKSEEVLGSYFNVINHGTQAMELILKGLSKASPFEDFLKDISDSGEIYAFGDSMNDLSMIESADIGIAMGNGKDEVKERADFVAESMDKDGLAKALRHFDLI